ncbi:heparinase II/III family protein [Pseudooceanicola sp. CBS1P-1]|uniref:Heparinase n=1 Tax=Pseudooceanicola albus TaxID=2692189 RepID=A0A6L7G7Y3_9RHOB|nr:MULTISPECIES: heparinase II/III family protein [Pseudooceanicola]MBT9384149.1 heparinase II/III family protein [Pseudooceanicola endophyticus]MXN19752.1 heparinase [Pseudooceanicola albus]
MSRSKTLPPGGTAVGALNRLQAWRATRGHPVSALISQPEPRSTGSYARGFALLQGNYLFSAQIPTGPGTLWQVEAPDAAFLDEIHGFAWLDDLAAVGSPPARDLAQRWIADWFDRYGRGQGPGWRPELAGRRLIRLVHHALFLLRGQGAEAQNLYFEGLARQTLFLARRARSAPEGLPRFEALCGLVCAGLALEGMEARALAGIAALEREAAARIGAEGQIPSRNPEELLEIFCLLTWAAAAIEAAGRPPAPKLQAAIVRIAPVLRRLRHGDGGLARFHGGGPGIEGRLDQALRDSCVPARLSSGMAMGYGRLQAGRTDVIVDADPPAAGEAGAQAHASTLAFELTSGRRPVVVSCGTGRSFGDDWRRAGRSTPSHSVLCLDGASSSVQAARSETLAEIPRHTPHTLEEVSGGICFEGAHDGYQKRYGLTHARKLTLSRDGRSLSGEDLLLALNDGGKRRFDRASKAASRLGVPWRLRFHLHPDVRPDLDLARNSVTLTLLSGESWVFQPVGRFELTVEPSVWLERGRLKPASTKQLVLSGRAMEYATRIRWSFAKAEGTPLAIRDVPEEEAEAPATEVT